MLLAAARWASPLSLRRATDTIPGTTHLDKTVRSSRTSFNEVPGGRQ